MAIGSREKPRFFPSGAAFRRWLARNYASASELWVGFYKKSSGRPSLTWPESVDEALCYGWIDGVRISLDDQSYAIRFTPRRRASSWSAVNLRRVDALKQQGRMTAAGLKAFEARDPGSSPSSFQDRPRQLPPMYLKILKRDKTAWDFFRACPPGYQRTAAFWVVSAKKEETRRRRLDVLIASCARRERIPALALPAGRTKPR